MRQNEQFLLFLQWSQLYLIIKLSFMGIVHMFANMFSKSYAANTHAFCMCERG